MPSWTIELLHSMHLTAGNINSTQHNSSSEAKISQVMIRLKYDERVLFNLRVLRNHLWSIASANLSPFFNCLTFYLTVELPQFHLSTKQWIWIFLNQSARQAHPQLSLSLECKNKISCLKRSFNLFLIYRFRLDYEYGLELRTFRQNQLSCWISTPPL